MFLRVYDEPLWCSPQKPERVPRH